MRDKRSARASPKLENRANPSSFSPDQLPFAPIVRLQRRVLGRLAAVLGRTITVAGPLLGLLLLNAELDPLPMLGLWITILVVSLTLGGRLVAVGQRMYATDAITLLRHDARAPILYLRQFSEDEFLDPTWASHQGGPGGSPIRYEDSLSQAMSTAGPFVALGRPGEDWPETGAARLYVADREWQQAVRFFLEHAATVVVAVGQSGSLKWELEESLRICDRRRILFFFPILLELRQHNIFAQTWHMYRTDAAALERARQAREQRYKSLCLILQKTLGCELPSSLGDAVFMDFDVKFQPRLLTSVPPGIVASLLRLRGSGPKGEIDIRKTLAPFLDKLAQMDTNSHEVNSIH